MRLVYLALAWVAGILLASTLPTLISLYWLVLLVLIGLVLLRFWQSPQRWRLLLLCAVAAGGYRYSFVPQTSDLALYNTLGNASLEGIIIAEPDLRDDRSQFRLAVDLVDIGTAQYPTSGLILVNAPRYSAVNYGDRVRVTGRMGTPAEYDTFSYADYLGRTGVFSVMDNALVEVLSSNHGNPLYAQLLAVKQRLQAQIARALPDPQAALLTGILLGNERGIDPKLAEAFNRTGAAHVIAISGFNMAILSGLVLAFTSRLFSRKWLGVLIGLGILAVYTLLVGANAAVVRAALMSSLLVIAPLFKRKTYVPASLAFVVLALSLAQPTILWDISFQLSFFAVLGLALFSKPLETAFEKGLQRFFPTGITRLLLSILNEPLIVSLAALSLTLPLTMLYFQRLSLVSLLVNLLIVPVQAYLLLLGGLALLVSLVYFPLAQVLFWLDMLLLSWTIGVVRIFGAWSNAEISINLHPQIVLFFYLSIIGGAIMRATRPPWLARFILQRAVLTTVSLGGLGIAFLLFSIWQARPDGFLHLWFLDVGHNNAILLESPQGVQMLIDGGRYPARLLTSMGDRLPFHDRHIEFVAITQPDEFEIAALPAVLQRYTTDLLLTNGQANQTELFSTLTSQNPVLAVRSGYQLEIADGVVIEVLHPKTAPSILDDLNTGSLVLRVRYGDVSFLLTGDLSYEGQAELLASGQWLGASVLQLPQHGTNHSLDEDFLAAVQAQVAILQSDKANRRNDPNLDTLALLGNTPLFRTDTEGVLHLWTDGHTLWIVPES